MSKVLNELINDLIRHSNHAPNCAHDTESEKTIACSCGLTQIVNKICAALPAVEAERTELIEALKWAMARINNPGVQEFGCSFCSAVFAGPNAQSDHNLKCPYGKALKQLVLALVKEK